MSILKGKGRVGRPEKKGIKKIVFGVAALAVAASAGFFLLGGDEDIGYQVLDEKDYPQEITSQVIPEYRTLERALACMVEEKVYVIATRGEKPTSGYELSIEKMTLSEKDGKTTLEVFVFFRDPESGTSLTQAVTYPLQVAATDLTALPDNIELKVQYKE